MKFLTEVSEEIQYITEEKNGEKDVYIEGIFMQAEKKNRNGRIYPKKVMEKAVEKYIKERIETGRSGGELNHPPTPQINPDRISHRITELKMDGDNVLGKALVLDTDTGRNVKGLLKGGIKLGVSSRGLASVSQKGGTTVVGEDFVINTVDIVEDPSAHDAFVEAVMEGAEWTLENDIWVQKRIEETKQIISKASSKELTEAKLKSFQNFMNALKGV
jgi:hypothetical protein